MTTLAPSESAAMTHDAEKHGGAHAHPPYLKVFAWLAGLTLVELFIPFVLSGAMMGMGVAILIAIAIWKILLIIRYFMHLKYDARLLGLIAGTPAVLASILVLGLWLEYGGWLS